MGYTALLSIPHHAVNGKYWNMAVLKEILSKEAIDALVADLALKICRDYEGQDVTVMGILNGAFMFMADLVRRLELNITIDFVQLASYGALTLSSGKIKFIKAPVYDFAGKNILIVEDVIDTGLTLQYLAKYLKANGAGSVKTCVFADKKCCRKVLFEADYVGYIAPDKFLVGYGLDYNGLYRQLPKLCELLVEN